MSTRLGPDLVSIMEGLPVGVFRTTVDGEILAVNQALARLLGYDDPAEVLGLDAADFYVEPGQRERGMSGLRGTGEIHGLEFLLRRRDGSHAWVREAARAVYGDDGSVLYYEGVLEDITQFRRARLELDESEAMFRSAFEEAPIGMAISTPNLSAIRVNGAFTSITGYTAEEAAGLSLEDLVHPDDLENARTRYQEILQGGSGSYRAERVLIHRDGHPIRVLLAVSPIRDENGGLVSILSQFVDVTEHRRAQAALAASEAQNRALLDAIPDFLFRLDRAGTFLGIQAPRPLKRPRVGQNVREVFPDLAEVGLEAIDKACRTGEIQELQVTITRASGAVHSYEARITAIDDEQALAIVRNVTEQRQAREALELLVKSKDDFVAAVSHELRTPLTTVVGLAYELRDRRHHMGKDQLDEVAALLADQAREMADLIEDLLVAARADLGQLTVDCEPVELRSQASAVLQGFPDGNITLEPSTETWTSADAGRVRQIVRNLVTNAARYGGSSVRVRVAGEPGHALIEVRDDGDGIPENEQERIFEPYYRATSQHTVPAAVGIGLSVSRDLARRMGGMLTYRREGGDSIFELRLPAA